MLDICTWNGNRAGIATRTVHRHFVAAYTLGFHGQSGRFSFYLTIRTEDADRRRQRNFIAWRGTEQHATRKAQQADGQRPQSEFPQTAATDGGGRASRATGLGGDDVLSGVHVSGRLLPCPLRVLMRL